MKNKIGFIIILLLMTVSFSVWSSASFEITPDIKNLVPEDALMYVQISNLENLIESLDSFLAVTGMNEFLGKMRLRDFFSMLIMSKNEDLSLDYFKLSNPVGFAILPSHNIDAEQKDIEYMLFLPINTDTNILNFLTDKPKVNDISYKIFMNYLVFFSSEELKNNFPSTYNSNLSHLDSYSNDSLSIYFDISGLMDVYDIDVSDLIKEMEYQDSRNLDFTVKLFEGYFNIFSQLDVLFSNTLINRKGITFKSDLFFSEKIKNLITSFQEVNNIKEWSRYLPQEGFIQSIYSIHPEDQKNIMEIMLEYLFPYGESDPFMSEYKRSMEMFTDYMGGGGAFSIDLIPINSRKAVRSKDDLKKKTVSNSGLPFEIRAQMVNDLTDEEGYLQKFREYYSGQTINNLMDSFYADLDFTLHINMEELNIDNFSPVFRMTYQIKKKETKSGNNFKEIEPIIEFLNNMEIWYHISDEKMYTYVGPLGIEGLKKLITIKTPMKSWVKSSPDNANLIWNCSLSRIINSLEGLKGMEMLPPLGNVSFEMSGFSGFKDGEIYSSTNIPAKHIMSIFQIIMEQGL